MGRMKSTRTLLLTMGALGLVTPASAGGRCTSLSVEADLHVRERWPELPGRIAASFEAREDIDTCAHVTVAHRGKFHVEVALPDGRVAERVVSRVEDVVPVLEALLLLPTFESPAYELPAPEPSAAPAPLPAIVTASVQDESPTPDRVEPVRGKSVPSKDHHLGFELSALTGVRAGEGAASVGIGALSFLDVNGWLIGLGGRVDDYSPSAPPTRAFEVAVLSGHRFRWNDLALDLVAGPAIVSFEQNGGNVVIKTAPGTRPPDDTSGSVPRLVTGARLVFLARSTFRTFVGIDGELGPPGAPAGSGMGLPVATLGFALGATVGTR